MPTTHPTGETRLSPPQRKLHDYITGLAADRKLTPASVLDQLIRSHCEHASAEEGFREFADRWGLSVKRLADLQELLGMEPAPQELRQRFPVREVDPAAVEADIDTMMAASEPQRRAERLECGIVDAELADAEPSRSADAPALDARTRELLDALRALGAMGAAAARVLDAAPVSLTDRERTAILDQLDATPTGGRAAMVHGIRALAEWLEAHPDAPVFEIRAWDCINKVDDDVAGERQLRALADRLGLPVNVDGDHDWNVYVEFGENVAWKCWYTRREAMRRHEAESSYRGRVEPDGGETR